jgi:hypothetical protein
MSGLGSRSPERRKLGAESMIARWPASDLRLHFQRFAADMHMEVRAVV